MLATWSHINQYWEGKQHTIISEGSIWYNYTARDICTDYVYTFIFMCVCVCVCVSVYTCNVYALFRETTYDF
jgi:hypothetical protein